MGVHYADILEYLLGPMSTVAGSAAVIDSERKDADGKLHPADAEDVTVGVGRFASGALATWLLSVAGRGEGISRERSTEPAGRCRFPATEPAIACN